MKRFALLTMTIAGVATALLAHPADPRVGSLVWNFSPSIAVGFYRIESGQWAKGDYVAVKPSPRLSAILTSARVLDRDSLLLKRVAAATGDTVCRHGLNVTINGGDAAVAVLRNSQGVDLPAWSGCLELSPGEVFLLGDHPASFDGRYFGASEGRSVVGRLSRIITWPLA